MKPRSAITMTNGTDADENRRRLAAVTDMMREMSAQTDPQEMVLRYGERIREVLPFTRRMSLSRRGLASPQYRITRYTGWTENINPWKEPNRTPVMSGGLLAELIYGDEPVVIPDLQPSPDDPAYEYLEGQRSLLAVPVFDGGVGINMVVLLREEPNGFSEDELPDAVWRSNLFGRATQNLVLAEQLKTAYERIDSELRVVAEMQRSLLPAELPRLPQLEFAAHYQTARRAGGDYYDVFPLPDGRCGVLIADVSGHGTPAAVMMAVTHAIAHMYPGPPLPPNALLEFVNKHLTARYTGDSGTFVTAFYGIIDPVRKSITYSSAGHPPPRLRDGWTREVTLLNQTLGLPLGIIGNTQYQQATALFEPTDQILIYTDGITEAQNESGEIFGLERLDQVFVGCACPAQEIVDGVMSYVREFVGDQEAVDDQTVVVIRHLVTPLQQLVRLD